MTANQRRKSQRGVLVPLAVVLVVLVALCISVRVQVQEREAASAAARRKRLMASTIAAMGIVCAEAEIRCLCDGTTKGIGNVSGYYKGGAYVVTATRSPASDQRWTLYGKGIYDDCVQYVEVCVSRRVETVPARGPAAENLNADSRAPRVAAAANRTTLRRLYWKEPPTR